jgi:hypothetical protein
MFFTLVPIQGPLSVSFTSHNTLNMEYQLLLFHAEINITKGSTSDDCQQINLQSIDSLSKTSKITCLEWGDNDYEILVGRENKFVKIFDPATSESLCQFEVKDGPVVGLARFDRYEHLK